MPERHGDETPAPAPATPTRASSVPPTVTTSRVGADPGSSDQMTAAPGKARRHAAMGGPASNVDVCRRGHPKRACYRPLHPCWSVDYFSGC
jgi:hypothetical protein